MTDAPPPASSDPPSAATDSLVLVRARGLRLAPRDRAPLGPLDVAIGPGLALIRGGEGTGKTTLLRVLAGQRPPDAGTVAHPCGRPFLDDPADPRDDPLPARAWLHRRRDREPGWNAALEARLVEAFGLAPHADKPLYMLSTGSRRKVGLVAAFASGAAAVMLDTPFAALDGPSRALLADLLEEAAGDPRRAWVVADFDAPAALARLRWSTTVDLGD